MILGAYIFWPLIYQENRYQVTHTLAQNNGQQNFIDATKRDFEIVIPKIQADAKILPDIDPNNPTEYLQALTKGVAHAKGTAKPGENGNIFLFAHSSDNFYNANRYNSVFYLLYKLEVGDNIYLTKDKKLYAYKVKSKEIVESENVTFLENTGNVNGLTLMTCWPPGTTAKRLIIQAD